MTELHTPSMVYGNLVLMMKRRGVNVPRESVLDTESVVRKLNTDEMATISGTRDASDPRGAANVTCILILPDSKYQKTADFRKLIQNQMRTGVATDQLPHEIILVSSEGLSTHVKKQISSFKAEMPNVLIEEHTYKIFMMDITRHCSVPEHTIATDAEVKEYCHTYCVTKDRFQKILSTDPQAVWLGLRPGMVVKITRSSETAGYAVVYRYCIK